MRKTISLFLAFVLLFSMVIPVSAQTPSLDNFEATKFYSGQFTDVKSTDWFATGVVTAYECGLMKGTSATRFSPNKAINAAEMATLIARIHSIVHTGTTDFKASDPWYDVYYDYLAENLVDIRDGDDPEHWYPSRLLFAWLVYAAIEDADLELISEVEDGAIPDIENPLDYSYEDYEFWSSLSVYMLYSAGILTGGKNGAFHPDDPITRAEVATIIARLADPDLRVSFTLEKKSTKAPSTSSSSSSSSSSSGGGSSASAQPSTTTTYIVNRNTGKFHYTWCSSVRQMKESNKIYSTASRTTLVSQGYSPCKRCCP